MEPLLPETSDSSVDFAAISTHASVVKDSNQLFRRYSDAIRRYATLLLHDPEDAEDVLLTVAQRMVEGRFSQATVEKGRFRFFIKRAVRNAALDVIRLRQRSRDQTLLKKLWNTVVRSRSGSGIPLEEPAAPPAEDGLEEAELSIWRETVLNRALEASLKELEKYERNHQDRTHPSVYHTLARLLIDHLDNNSDQLARRLGEQVGGEYNANQVRAIVLRMRKKLAELLVVEIVPQLKDPTLANVLEELGELGLLAYIEPYLPPTSSLSGA